MTSSMDDSDDEFDQLAPPDNELDKVHVHVRIIIYKLSIPYMERNKPKRMCTHPNQDSKLKMKTLSCLGLNSN